MGDRMANAMAWLARKRQEADGVSVIYRRGAQSVTLTAVPGQSILRLSDRYGNSRVERTQTDYMVLAADLELGGSATEPQRGDTIEQTLGGVTLTLKVLPPGEGEPCWRWCDENRTAYRIHTKLIEES